MYSKNMKTRKPVLADEQDHPALNDRKDTTPLRITSHLPLQVEFLVASSGASTIVGKTSAVVVIFGLYFHIRPCMFRGSTEAPIKALVTCAAVEL
jgi:hypothetical protein